MRKMLLFFLYTFIHMIFAQGKCSQQDFFFSLTTTNTWCEYKNLSPSKKRDKRVIIEEIKLKSKDHTFVSTLKARWHGENIKNLVGSLYSKKITDHKNPVPIEKNLICDGKWNNAKKEFIFPVNKKIVASDTYYLMLHVPKKDEKLVQAGFFEITQEQKKHLLSSN